MSHEKTIVANRFEAIDQIKAESTGIIQLFYNRRNNTSWELRSKSTGSFILVTHDGGKKGFDIYYPSRKNNIQEFMNEFEDY